MRTINQKSRPSICYSNISLIKKALLQNPKHILPYPEIVLYLKKNWTNVNNSYSDIEEIVNLALYAPKSYFKEVEEGLWGIRDQVDARLNHIYNYMNQNKFPLKLSEMKNKLKFYESNEMLNQLLMSDIRFSQIDNTTFWILSEWVVINDLIYDYIIQSDLVKLDKKKAIERVVEIHHLDHEKVIFLPQIDDRFNVFHTNSGDTIEIKKIDSSAEDKDTNKEINIPIEINEEIGRISYKIIQFIKNSEIEVSTNEIVSKFIKLNTNEPSFLLYFDAVQDLLHVIPEISQTEDNNWIYNDVIPDLHFDKEENVYYAVRNSKPDIHNIDELKQAAKPSTNKYKYKDGAIIFENKQADDKNYVYYTISYYDRVKGYFVIPSSLIESSILFRQNHQGIIMAQHNDSRYEWNWKKSGNKYYFFGDGVMDFLSDNLIEPGHKLRFEMNKQVLYFMNIYIVGFDERYATEQQRFLDIGRIVEQSKSVNKSIFSLMCETLSIYPSGLHWSILQDKISEKRQTTKNTITNLLSRNECFEQVVGQKGYWRLNISKLSRKHINEEDQEILEETDTILDLINEENEKDIEAVPNTEEITNENGTANIEHIDMKGNQNTEVTIENENGVSIVDEPKELLRMKQEDLIELQQLPRTELMLTIQNNINGFLSQEELFKKQISSIVKDNFMNGDIPVIQELYKRVESHIVFFNQVRNFVENVNCKNEDPSAMNNSDDDVSFNREMILNYWDNYIKACSEKINSYIELLLTKKSECENELHQLVSDTTISDRTNRMIFLMEEQEQIIQLKDHLKEIKVELNSMK